MVLHMHVELEALNYTSSGPPMRGDVMGTRHIAATTTAAMTAIMTDTLPTMTGMDDMTTTIVTATTTTTTTHVDAAAPHLARTTIGETTGTLGRSHLVMLISSFAVFSGTGTTTETLTGIMTGTTAAIAGE